MKLIKKRMSLLLVICLFFTSLGFQPASAAAFQVGNSGMVASGDSTLPNTVPREETAEPEEPLTDQIKEAAQDQEYQKNRNSQQGKEGEHPPLKLDAPVDNQSVSVRDDKAGDLQALLVELNDDDEQPPQLSQAYVNGTVLMLNFDKKLQVDQIPSIEDFKVKVTYPRQQEEKSGGPDVHIIDPGYTSFLDPAYKSALDTTIYSILMDNEKIKGIDVYDNKVVLTLDTAVTSSGAVTLDYEASRGDHAICDEWGNAAESFSNYHVENITGGSNIPDFTVEEVYNELDTSALSEDLAYQVYCAMKGYRGTREGLLGEGQQVIRILAASGKSYGSLDEAEKEKLHSFFRISDSFFNYAQGKGEDIEQAAKVYYKMLGFGLTEEEIEKAIEDNRRDEIITEKEQEEESRLNPAEPRRLLQVAEEDPFSEVKVDKEKVLGAPFQHNEAASEQINLGSGVLTYNVVDARLPGKGGLDLTIARQYSTELANYYNVSGMLKYADSEGGKAQSSYMNVSERVKYFAKAADGTMGESLGKSDYKVKSRGDFVSSDSLKGYYNLQEMKDTGDQYAASLYSKEMTTNQTYMQAKQTSNPATRNDELWQIGTGWKFNFSYMDIDTFNFDYMKLHLSDGRDFGISSNWVNNLGRYTYKDVIFSKQSATVAGKSSSYNVTYADGKKEYFNSDGRLAAIVDRFGNTISFGYTTVNNNVEITITDTLGQITTIKNDRKNKILKLPDGQTVTYGRTRNYAMELNGMRQYEKYPGQFDEYNLSFVTNQEGEVTDYSYKDIECPSGFAARYKLTTKKKFMSSEAFDDGQQYYPNYYAALQTITYPTNLRVNYEYYTRVNNWYDYGCDMDIAIKKRYDEQYSNAYNTKEYIYSYQYRKNGELIDVLYKADGYNNSFREDRPFDDWEDYCIKEKDVDRNIIKEYYFNPREGTCTQEKTYLNSDLIQQVINEHRKYNYFIYPSKTKVTTEQFKTSSYGKTLKAIECFDYDSKGNAIAYWPALAEGNTADSRYKVSLTYNDRYNYVTKKTYKRDLANTTTEWNVPSADGKTIVQSYVDADGAVKAKTDFAYDFYGNVIQDRQYTDIGAGTFIETKYNYKDGTYLTGIAVQNVKDADGQNLGVVSRQATYDIYGRILTEADGKGQVTSYTYDKLGRVTGIQYPDHSSKSYVYSTSGNRTTEMDERGYATRYQYDPAGNLIAVYSAEAGAEILLRENKYDSLYRLIREQNNLSKGGAVRTYSYDHKDRVTEKATTDQERKSLARETATYYDDVTIKTVVGDTNSNSIGVIEYRDQYGRITKKGQYYYGIEKLSSFDYDYLGQVVTEKSARANEEGYPESYTAKYEYDYAGNVIKQYDVNQNYITMGYDAAGRKIWAADARSNAAGGSDKAIYTYDALGRLVKEETPFTAGATAVTKYYYDANGNVIKKQVKNSLPNAEDTYATVENVYDNKDQLVQVKSYDGKTLANQVDYTYDAAGNRTAMKTAGGTQVTTYEYDQYGHLTGLTDPLGQKEAYAYDINGNMISKTDKNGNMLTFTYDGLSRGISQSTTKNGVEQSETKGYTLTGAVAFTQNENLRTDFVYNSLGKISKETNSNGIQKEYTYDTHGNLMASVVKVNGTPKKSMTYVYDKKDRLVQVFEAGNLVASYTYDVNGNRSGLTYGNGIQVDYGYNLANLLTALHNKKGTATLSGYVYTYYTDGNQAAKKDHMNRWTSYSYDGLGRLTRETESGDAEALTKAYAFDGAGNRASMTVSGAQDYTVNYAYDLNNRLTKENKKTGDAEETTDYYYDNNGNTIAKTTGTLKDSSGKEAVSVSLDFAGSELYGYDGFDRMTETQNSDGTNLYTYSPDGLRLSKTVNGVKTTQVWEGSDIILQLDGEGTVADRYIRGAGLINSDKNGWYLFNAHGDVVQLTDGTGTAIKEYAYDAFGSEENIDKNDGNPYRYSGEYFDDETGRIYLRARYYEPEIGRFLTEDSYSGKAEDPLSLNRYTYCGNDPVNFIDITGNDRMPPQEMKKTLKAFKDSDPQGYMTPVEGAIAFGDFMVTSVSIIDGAYTVKLAAKGMPIVIKGIVAGSKEEAKAIALKTVRAEVKSGSKGLAKGAGKGTKTTLDYLKGVEKINGSYYAPKNVIDDIGKIEAKGVNFSNLRSNVMSTRASTEGGFSKVIRYSDSKGTKFIVHEVTDKAGNLLHRDFDAVRIQSGQLINKLPK